MRHDIADAGRVAAGRHGLPLVLALAMLGAGLLIYLVERDPARVWLMPAGWSIASLRGALPAVVRDNAPSFVHAFAFSVLTAMCLRSTRRSIAAACAGWFVVDTLFEIGQHPAISAAIANALPNGFARAPLVGHLRDFFVGGHFDSLDLAAAAIGATLAGAVLVFARHLNGRT